MTLKNGLMTLNRFSSGLAAAAFVLVVPLFTALPSFAFSPSICDADSGNLVLNCGFELDTGFQDLEDWTVSGGSPTAFLSTTPVNSGNFAATFTSNVGDAYLSQTLSTVAGDSYTFSFYLDVVGGETLMQADWNGTTELDLTSTSTIASGYQLYSYDVTATSSSTVIQFGGLDPVGYNYLDDVEVNLIPSGAAIPEPSTIPVLAVSLILMGIVVRRKLIARTGNS